MHNVISKEPKDNYDQVYSNLHLYVVIKCLSAHFLLLELVRQQKQEKKSSEKPSVPAQWNI